MTANLLRVEAGRAPGLRGLLSGETVKAARSRSLVLLAWFGVVLCAFTSYGYAAVGAEQGLDEARVTDDVLRAWMMMFLFAGIFAAMYVGREFDSRAITRTVLLAPSRDAVLGVKALVVAGAGAGFGVLSVLGGVLCAFLMPPTAGLSALWSSGATATAAGLLACNVLAALWGGAVALVVRNQVVASFVVVAVTLLVDPGVQRIWPEVARFFFTIALSSVYRDPKPDLLSVPVALVVACAWVVGTAAVGRAGFLRRDLP